ncbi:hypothetical protein OG458_42035 (plasmid) [Streptomyces sp. NBC_01281]|uniref:hypothetical protein n=1 Tax=Streptomyces sp. NBC_01281 TaxID=2903811 RepID=UPI002E0E6028|nr:hypothetical protein OG458_42035 [Streptomyces sp. NBC_01281]
MTARAPWRCPVALDPEVRRGGGLPFGMVCSRWVCDPRYTANARTLYTILVTYSDTHSRDTGRGKPYRRELAAQLGVSLSTLDRVLTEMEVAGLATVQRRTDPANPKLNDANLYVLHDAEAWNGTWTDPLPPDVTAADVAKTVVEARRAAKREVGGGVKGEATPGFIGEARVASPMKPNIYTPVQNPSREVVDGRRPPTGSRAPGVAGGSAASRKTTQRGLTRDERRAVDEVWALLPEGLVAVVPRETRYLEESILEALALGRPEERTVDQLVTHRVMPRWAKHWAAEFEAGRVAKPVGALRALLQRDPLCNDARCDEHVEVDTGAPCRACERTREDRRPVCPQPRTPTLPPVLAAVRKLTVEAADQTDHVVADAPSADTVQRARAALRAGNEQRRTQDRRSYGQRTYLDTSTLRNS